MLEKSEPTEADDFGWIPLHYAAHLGDKELVKLFLENDKSLAYITDNEGMSALHISAKKGHVGVNCWTKEVGQLFIFPWKVD